MPDGYGPAPDWNPFDVRLWSWWTWSFFGSLLLWGFALMWLGGLQARLPAGSTTARIVLVLRYLLFVSGWLFAVYWGWC